MVAAIFLYLWVRVPLMISSCFARRSLGPNELRWMKFTGATNVSLALGSINSRDRLIISISGHWQKHLEVRDRQLLKFDPLPLRE